MNIHTLNKITYVAAMTGLVVLLAGMLWGQGVPSQGQYPQSQAPPSQMPPGQTQPGMQQQMPTTTNAINDNDFAKEAAQGGMAEVKLGQLAEDKGQSDAVKNFGKKMVDDHSAANDKLKAVASNEKVDLPAAIDKHDQKTYDKLSQLSGAAFDRAYAKDMVKDHEKDIDAFKQEASGGQNQAIKNFASETLPTLQEHLKMAKEMESTVSATGNKGAQ
jgi:putative membrane protein